MPSDIKIVRVTEAPGLGEAGRPVVMIQVEWTVGADGPFLTSIPKGSFSSDTMYQTIRKMADELKQLRALERRDA